LTLGVIDVSQGGRTFVPRSTRLVGEITLAGPIAEVFELFSPLGEKLWVPGWDPEILHPADESWQQGSIFRTREEMGDAIWVITRLDRERHEVEYHRVEPGRYVARVTVRCSEFASGSTTATIAYEFLGLSEKGNADIAAMTDDAYSQKMNRWTGWINTHLSRGSSRG
jgi:hypothetical protein